MKNAIKKWFIAPAVFLIVYLFGNLIGAAICVVRFQIANEGGRAPSEPGGWLITITFCTVVAMLNLCGLNQVLIMPFCFWPRLRQAVGFRFAILSGFLFSALPLTIKEILRQTSGYRISFMNETRADYALSWVTCGVLFLTLAWLCATWRNRTQRNRTTGSAYAPTARG